MPSDLLEYNEGVGAGNTLRPLTRSSGISREGLGMEPTRRTPMKRSSTAMKRTPLARTPKIGPGSEEYRFQRMVMWGEMSEHRPDLGQCLLYTGGDNGNGYGQFRYNKRNGYAHRYAWERDHGPIPDGLTIDHLCRVRCCVNTTHMELVDGITNYLRGVATRKVCPNGHPYPMSFTPGGKGKARCRECRRGQWQRGEAKRAAKRAVHGNLRIKYDQTVVRQVITEIRRAETTIARGSRRIGCNANYLGRRVWEETKRDVFARDGSRCVRCGTVDGLDAHHRIPRGMGGHATPAISFGMANIITVCREHHADIESRREWATALGLLVPQHADPATTPVLTRHGRVLLADTGGIEAAG